MYYILPLHAEETGKDCLVEWHRSLVRKKQNLCLLLLQLVNLPMGHAQQAVTGVKPQWPTEKQQLFSSDSKRKCYVNTQPVRKSVYFGRDGGHSLSYAGAVIICPWSSEGNVFWCEKALLYTQLSHVAHWASQQNIAGRSSSQILQATLYFQPGVRMERKSNCIKVKCSIFSLGGVSLPATQDNFKECKA